MCSFGRDAEILDIGHHIDEDLRSFWFLWSIFRKVFRFQAGLHALVAKASAVSDVHGAAFASRVSVKLTTDLILKKCGILFFLEFVLCIQCNFIENNTIKWSLPCFHEGPNFLVIDPEDISTSRSACLIILTSLIITSYQIILCLENMSSLSC